MNSRAKGTRAEREVARLLRDAGFDVVRTPNSGGLNVKGDITGLDGFHVEVKRRERAAIFQWLAQAEAECGDSVPLVVFRRSRSAWYCALPLSDLIPLLRGAAHR